MKRVHKASTYIGSTIVIFLLIPEIITVIKQKSAKGLSYLFLTLQVLMGFCFLIFQHGVYIGSGLSVALPGFISNSISIIFASVLIYLKHKYEKENSPKLI